MADQTPILEPGKEIRPKISPEEVKLLAERLYGISVLELTELNGYDDRNFKIIEDPNVKNPLIPNHCPDGYVLKIMNSLDSQNLDVVEAQNEIMNFLNGRSVKCPKPVRNVFGHYFSTEVINGVNHVVRLLEFVPGTLFKDVPLTDPLVYQLGVFIAVFDNKLQHFNHSGVMNREHIWMLSKVPELDKFKHVIKDPEHLDLVEEVIEEFKYAVVPQMEELEQGVIHGDFNEMNILVEKKEGQNDYTIAGILDMGDIHCAPRVFELAVAATYVALAGGARAVAVLLAGYRAVRPVPANEYRLLKTLICSRLVQSLVLGAYTLSKDPTNSYVSSTEKQNGWQLLKDLRKKQYSSEEEDPTDWKALADDYLTRS